MEIQPKIRNDLKDLLSNSYKPQAEAQENLKKKGYGYDNALSTMNSKIFINEDNGEPIIVHRGTTRLSDWIDNAKIAVGLGKYSNRVKEAKELNKKVEEKYKKPVHNTGHSLGGYLAENTGGNGNILTYNKASGLGDLFTKKNSGRQLDIFAEGDLPSVIARNTQKSNRQVVKNKRPSIIKPINVLNSHNLNNLTFH